LSIIYCFEEKKVKELMKKMKRGDAGSRAAVVSADAYSTSLLHVCGIAHPCAQ